MPMAGQPVPVRNDWNRAEFAALCFSAGANSIYTGDRLLTAPNAGDDADGALFARLGLRPMVLENEREAAE